MTDTALKAALKSFRTRSILSQLFLRAIMTNSAGHFYEFGPFRVDVANLLLFRDGQPLSLAPKAVETLIALVQHGGQLVKKDDLIRIVWSDRIVDESNLSQNIYLLRKTLGDGSNGKNCIETVPRRGYRFVGEVRECNATGTDLIFAGRTEIQPVLESHNGIIEQSDSRSLDYRSSHTTRSLNRGWRLMVFLAGTAVVTLATFSYFAFFRRPGISETKATLLKTRVGAVSEGFSEQHLTTNSDAYGAYIQGRYYWGKQTTPALEQAIQQYQEALRYDPNYALPYAGLAEAYALLGSHYDSAELSPSDAMSKAKAAALKSIEMNDAVAETHTALGAIMERYDWDWSGAEREFKRAIELNPNYAHAHQEYSLYLSAVGRSAEAEMKRAEELDPTSQSIGKDMGDLFYLARDYEKALEQYRLTLKIDPTDPLAVALHRAMAWTYELSGMHEQAIAEFIETSRIQNAGPERLTAFRRGYDAAGTKGYCRTWLELQRERIERGRINLFYLAQVYAFIGDNDRAFACLQKSLQDHSLDAPALRYSPSFDELRKDGRYRELLKKMRLD
jgi:DNA-binding winged helix-turn-helix (wHTH) protein/tetratricopeptide (TPR) repeat protein